MIELLYRGFDGLDVSFKGQITNQLADALETAKAKAQKYHHPAPLEWNGIHLSVGESGAKGGYAFCASTGEFGATWFFKKPNVYDPWGIRVSCNSFLLATEGLGGTRASIYADMETLGIELQSNAESIGRVDYALDYLAPAFSLAPDNFVMHSNARRADHYEMYNLGVSGHSSRVTSVTVGKMPGRQVIIYDKCAEIVAKRKPAWWEIWDAARAKAGLPIIVRAGPARSEIWRVEIRADKKHLKERWGISSWRDLDDRFGDLVATCFSVIRHTQPSGDSNRSRWPDSPLWKVVRRDAEHDLFEMRNYAAPELIKLVQLEEHDRMLARQMTGVLTTRAGLRGVSFHDLATFAENSATQMAESIEEDPERYAKKLIEATGRYYVAD